MEAILKMVITVLKGVQKYIPEDVYSAIMEAIAYIPQPLD